MMLKKMFQKYRDKIIHTNKLTEGDKWNSLYENIEMLKDIARDLYLNID